MSINGSEYGSEFFREDSRPPILRCSDNDLEIKFPDGRREKFRGVLSFSGSERVTEIFQKEPGGGFSIQAGKKRQQFSPDTILEVPHYLGFVTCQEFLQDLPETFSNKDFFERLALNYRVTRDKLEIVEGLAKAANLRVPTGGFGFGILKQTREAQQHKIADGVRRKMREQGKKSQEISWATSEIYDTEFFPSPEELVRYSFEILINTGSADPEITRVLQEIQLNEKFVQAKTEAELDSAVLPIFYSWAKISGRDVLTFDGLISTLREFPFVGYLMRYYERSQGGEWGGTLLAACSEFYKDWARE